MPDFKKSLSSWEWIIAIHQLEGECWRLLQLQYIAVEDIQLWYMVVCVYSCVNIQLCKFVHICIYNPWFVGIFNRIVSNSFLILSFLLVYVFLGLYTFKLCMKNTIFFHINFKSIFFFFIFLFVYFSFLFSFYHIFPQIFG